MVVKHYYCEVKNSESRQVKVETCEKFMADFSKTWRREEKKKPKKKKMVVVVVIVEERT